jgi:hypothetical protein
MWADGTCTSCDYDHVLGRPRFNRRMAVLILVVATIFAWSTIILGLAALL